jgi:uncharacterized Zn finger protein
MSFYSWRPYVSVAQRRANARKEMTKLAKKGKNIQPIELDGRKIATSYWGKAWCDHLESFSDYDNRLPRGRTYVRNGSVCHLEVQTGRVEALVSGSDLYKVVIEIAPLVRKTWDAIQAKCRGQIGSVLELLQGRLSNHVMGVVSDRKEGLFPQKGEIELKCSCPDGAVMCKHVAAVLYGVGSRLDHQPDLLFVLRGVDAAALISADMELPTATAAGDALAAGGLADIFGVDIDPGDAPLPAKTKKPRKVAVTAKTSPPEAPPTAVPATMKAKKAAAPKKAKGPFNPKAPTGAGIARLRKLLRLTMAKFAAALGVSAASVQRWEGIKGPVSLQARPLAALVRLQDEHLRQ